MADKGIQVAVGLKDHGYVVRQNKLPQLKQNTAGLNVVLDEGVMGTRRTAGSGHIMTYFI